MGVNHPACPCGALSAYDTARVSPTVIAGGLGHADGISFAAELPMKCLLLICCLFPGLVSAGTLYRCIGTDGQVSYLATPCAAGQRMDRSIEFAPEPDSTIPVPSASRRTAAKHARTTASSRRGSNVRQSRVHPCLQARAKREQQLERIGLKRTFDQLSKLDEPVRKACRGY